MIERLQDTLHEFGGAFVGRQGRFELGSDEYFVDLLLFHVEEGMTHELLRPRARLPSL